MQEILHSINMNLSQNLRYESKQRCFHMIEECKQNEAFMTELFETIPNSLYFFFFEK